MMRMLVAKKILSLLTTLLIWIVMTLMMMKMRGGVKL